MTSNARRHAIVTSTDPKVAAAWKTLESWHRETKRSFFGHVGNNPYQTYRYVEAMRHVVRWQKHKRRDGNNSNHDKATINVCETGFNGGHSAMLFLSFLDKIKGVDVNYWGWDLKEVGSASPVAEKMKTQFGDNFHIFWGEYRIVCITCGINFGNPPI